jgi:hypothetical protein
MREWLRGDGRSIVSPTTLILATYVTDTIQASHRIRDSTKITSAMHGVEGEAAFARFSIDMSSCAPLMSFFVVANLRFDFFRSENRWVYPPNYVVFSSNNIKRTLLVPQNYDSFGLSIEDE